MANGTTGPKFAWRRVLLVGLAALWLAACVPREAAKPPEPLLVSTAANLAPAFTQIAQAFQAETDIPVTLNVGATGKLVQQIEQGAPADVLAAASRAYVEELVRGGRVDPADVIVFARGRLTLWTSPGKAPLARLADLASPGVTKVVIANPEHAPYGAAAREALQAAGVWEAVAPKLVYAGNIMQAQQIAESGNVDAGILALSLSLTSGGRWVLIPEELHTPLEQVLAVMRGTEHEEAARRFVAFVRSAAGQAILADFGFVQPVEEVAP